MSSLAGIGVSTGTSYTSTPHAAASAAHTRAAPATARLLFVFRLNRAVIDFLEQIVVLANLRVVRIERQRFFVRPARLVELSLVLVGDAEVVEGRGVFRVELDGLFPAVNGLAPEPPLGDVDAELHLLPSVGSAVGQQRRGR